MSTSKEKDSVKQNSVGVVVPPPNEITAEFKINGIAPYVQLKFSEKAKKQIMEKHRLGSQSKKGNKKEARNFEEDYENAQHISTDGWNGIPASSFRNALISACRLVGFQMTKAKLAVFVIPDGFDKEESTPLVKIVGSPKMRTDHVRNESGVVDIRARAEFWPWSAKLRVRFDADLFSLSDISNLLMRVGRQVGIGEGRPDGKKSYGMGWGLFEIEGRENE